ncbi:MAG TPA: T9SS type A sorting domain-containing protein, partial [Bacteroidia bacterium]|nr:T9SS type A sorting domain-containing protein [Bacteroidia bacterium]
NNCKDSIMVTLTQPPALTLTVSQVNPTCSGLSNGSATATVTGGTPAYMYNWSNLQNQPVGTGLSAGTYTCVVTDANGCKDSTTATLTQPAPIAITYTLMQDATPHVWDVFPSVTGGTTPFTYSWNWGDASANSTTPYPSHTYSVPAKYNICLTITDANLCTNTYCQNDTVYRVASNSTMVTVNVINGPASIYQYQKLLADTVTEFDIVASCMTTLKQNNAQQTLSNCVDASANMAGGIPNRWVVSDDSLYNGKHYKKVNNTVFFNQTAFEGLMREDTVAKKVYFIQNCNTTEDLLYNFSLTQGDTITYNFTYSTPLMSSGVYTVDSVRMQHDYINSYFRHFYLRNHAVSTNLTLEMIEGVGNVTHPLFLYASYSNGFYSSVSSCSAASFAEALSCKFNNNIKIYTDSCLEAFISAHGSNTYTGSDACSYCLAVGGGIEQHGNTNQVRMLPNPAQNSFTIETTANDKQMLFVFDVNGKLVLNQFIQDKTTIDISNLNAGVYSVNIVSNEGTVTKKLVVVK